MNGSRSMQHPQTLHGAHYAHEYHRIHLLIRLLWAYPVFALLSALTHNLVTIISPAYDTGKLSRSVHPSFGVALPVG